MVTKEGNDKELHKFHSSCSFFKVESTNAEGFWQWFSTDCLRTAGELTDSPSLSFADEKVQNAILIASEDFINSWIDYFEANTETPSLDSAFCILSRTRLCIENVDFGCGEAKYGSLLTALLKRTAKLSEITAYPRVLPEELLSKAMMVFQEFDAGLVLSCQIARASNLSFIADIRITDRRGL
ncbi:hypothetical protein SADUNF_Sadunf14G0127700 [Salix dunnii]|uniref:Uncharacterized protein n=1 Tax=Salix dunnii TaxID=1413687 RepID=A0A835MMP7_9ROSI|nr:hypothetical protein SADUNF_Sadunf14G0127700 [Salix dunnii]